MFLLQANQPGISLVLFMGTLGMLVLTIGLILFIIFHQRKVIRYQLRLQQMEQEQQKILLNASIRLQEEERQRLPADLHDDAGPLLATARPYLNENLVNQDKATQLQSIFQARQIIEDTIQLVRNKSNVGLGLKNISSRLRLVQGNINFEKDSSQTYYKVTIEMPKDEPYE